MNNGVVWNLLYYLSNRIKEPSTWAGLGTFLTGIGVTISPQNWQIIMGIGMGLGGMMAVILPARVTESQVKPDAGTPEAGAKP